MRDWDHFQWAKTSDEVPSELPKLAGVKHGVWRGELFRAILSGYCIQCDRNKLDEPLKIFFETVEWQARMAAEMNLKLGSAATDRVLSRGVNVAAGS